MCVVKELTNRALSGASSHAFFVTLRTVKSWTHFTIPVVRPFDGAIAHKSIGLFDIISP